MPRAAGDHAGRLQRIDRPRAGPSGCRRSRTRACRRRRAAGTSPCPARSTRPRLGQRASSQTVESDCRRMRLLTSWSCDRRIRFSPDPLRAAGREARAQCPSRTIQVSRDLLVATELLGGPRAPRPPTGTGRRGPGRPLAPRPVRRRDLRVVAVPREPGGERVRLAPRRRARRPGSRGPQRRRARRDAGRRRRGRRRRGVARRRGPRRPGARPGGRRGLGVGVADRRLSGGRSARPLPARRAAPRRGGLPARRRRDARGPLPARAGLRRRGPKAPSSGRRRRRGRGRAGRRTKNAIACRAVKESW